MSEEIIENLKTRVRRCRTQELRSSVFFTDDIEEFLKLFQSERQARLNAETKLRELQDAVVQRYTSFDEDVVEKASQYLQRTIQESRTRNSES